MLLHLFEESHFILNLVPSNEYDVMYLKTVTQVQHIHP